MTALVSGLTLQYYLAAYFEEVELKAMICDSSFSFNKNTHTLTSSVTGEVVGTGYTAGGISLTGASVEIDTSVEEVHLVADDLEFGVISVTDAAQIVIYTLGTTAAPSRIISVHTFTPSNISQNFTYTWPIDLSGNGVVGVFPY